MSKEIGLLNSDDFKPAGDTYPTLREHVQRVMDEQFAGEAFDLNDVRVSEPDEKGIVRVFVPRARPSQEQAKEGQG